MRPPLFVLVVSALLCGHGLMAQTFVKNTDGAKVRLHQAQFGVPYASPYSSKIPIERYQYYLDSEGKRVFHGLKTLIYVDGRQKELSHYVHGKKHGRFARWYDQGGMEVEGQYNHGQLEGRIHWFYESGQMKTEEAYLNGELEGPFIVYYENGFTQEEGTFRQGAKEGKFIRYYENGNKALEGTYAGGFLNGAVAVYHVNGTPAGGGILHNDIIRGDWHCLLPDGSVAAVREDCRRKVYLECSC